MFVVLKGRFSSIGILSLLVFTTTACPPNIRAGNYDGGIQPIGGPCENDNHCLDKHCYQGMCVSPNPLDNGLSCTSHGQCKSLQCSGGMCVQGPSGAGKPCRYNEQCYSQACQGGACASTYPYDARPPDLPQQPIDWGPVDMGPPSEKPPPPPDLPPPTPDLPKTCGNGVINAGEECDGTNLKGATCAKQGFTAGKISCKNCKLDTAPCFKMVTIPAGTFTMGTPLSEPCRDAGEVQHKVTLTNAFLIQTTEVTRSQFVAVMGYDGSLFPCGLNCPVEMKNWYETAAYANALSNLEGLPNCYACTGSGPKVNCTIAAAYSGAKIYNCPGYRMPTEAEFEYATRAGTTTAYYSGPNDPNGCTSTDANLDKIAWYNGNSNNTTHPVATKQPNAWGLYDMVGNVWEWCNGWEIAHTAAPVTNPWGSPTGSYRSQRNGAWGHPAAYARAGRLYAYPPGDQFENFGMRMVKTK